jgi:hypothetical protein
LWVRLFECLDFDVFVADFIAVILQEDMAFFCFSEVLPDFVLADRYQVAVFFGTSLIFDHFHPVDVMLDLIVGIDNHSALVPFPGFSDESGLLVGFDQVIE